MEAFAARVRAWLAGAADLADGRALLVEFRDAGGTQEAAAEALEALRVAGLSEAHEDRLLELLDLVTGWCRPDCAVWSEPAVRWWLHEPDLPRARWCRGRVLRDGSWELIDHEHELHRFLDADSARAWLGDEEYSPAPDHPELTPPPTDQHLPEFALEAHCTTCGAVWRKAILDSQDSGEAHWFGACAGRPD